MFHKDGRIEFFKDRFEAGFLLGEELRKLNLGLDVVVLGIPRGGVIVSSEVSKILRCPHGSVSIKKIPAPQNLELAIGAVSAKGSLILDKELIDALGVSPDYLKKEIQIKRNEAKKRSVFFGENLVREKVLGKTVIIVDDGVATGSTVMVSREVVTKMKAKKIILATPIISKKRASELKKVFDELVSLTTPDDFQSVGQFYQDFSPPTDEQVKFLLGDSK